MSWSIHHVALQAHSVARTAGFLRDLVGLGETFGGTEGAAHFGADGRGAHVLRPDAGWAQARGVVHNPTMRGHVAITVADIGAVAGRLDKAGIPWTETAEAGRTIYCYDPSWNLVAFNRAPTPDGSGIHPWEMDWGWGIHHVNLQAIDVRESVGFFVEIAGMAEGRWEAPAAMGKFSIDRSELAILPLGEGNRGLHLIRPDAGFAQRNGFAHNPSIGGHPALWVPDIHAVMARLDAAGWPYSDAGVYAMPGMHQIYCFDPSANMLEINQYV